ncbi:hypothetical protein NDU88_005423 [Pleurodeles waltl]|uniref:Uncharacterized protein n=1 Tax=Pleurodeles waltl TaxID=8319 RepID=A0AAV7NV99_PLEWA|nr:hypothetical protein NDU88_005423 [Pleurodeles waltl]
MGTGPHEELQIISLWQAAEAQSIAPSQARPLCDKRATEKLSNIYRSAAIKSIGVGKKKKKSVVKGGAETAAVKKYSHSGLCVYAVPH